MGEPGPGRAAAGRGALRRRPVPRRQRAGVAGGRAARGSRPRPARARPVEAAGGAARAAADPAGTDRVARPPVGAARRGPLRAVAPRGADRAVAAGDDDAAARHGGRPRGGPHPGPRRPAPGPGPTSGLGPADAAAHRRGGRVAAGLGVGSHHDGRRAGAGRRPPLDRVVPARRRPGTGHAVVPRHRARPSTRRRGGSPWSPRSASAG